MACVESGVIRMCQVCGGKGYVSLPLTQEARYVTLDDSEDLVLPSNKEYLCPECQPVFYRDDLEPIHAGQIVPGFAVGDTRYIEHVWHALSRKLGSLLPNMVRKQKKLVNYTLGDEELHVTAWVLRKEAHKKLYRTTEK